MALWPVENRIRDSSLCFLDCRCKIKIRESNVLNWMECCWKEDIGRISYYTIYKIKEGTVDGTTFSVNNDFYEYIYIMRE